MISSNNRPGRLFIVDLHTHTSRYSVCSLMTPEQLIRRAQEVGLDCLCLTEHDARWTSTELARLKERACSDALLLLSGVEVSCYADERLAGHYLAFGYAGPIDYPVDAPELVERVHGEGGVVIAAHPYRPGMGPGDALGALDLDGVEVMTPNHSQPASVAAAEAMCRRKQWIPFASSDAHHTSMLGRYAMGFESRLATEQDLVREIRAGRCVTVSSNGGWNTRTPE